MTIDVMAIGGCTVDVVHAADRATRGRQLGGSAIYAAAGARIWGLNSGVVAFRGMGLPEGWDGLLTALGIDMDGLVPVDLPAAVSEFFYDAGGARMERTWSADGGGPVASHLPADTGEPIRRLRLAPDHIPERYRGARGAHLAPLHFPVQRALLGALGRIGVITLDPYPHVMADCTDEDLKTLLAPLWAFMPSVEEVRARFPDIPMEKALDRLLALSPVTTIIKQGKEGSLVYDRQTGRRWAVPAVPVTVKDPTGAGDAFCGGVQAGLIEGRDIVHAAVCGTVSAAFAVEDFCLDGMRGADPTERDRRYRWVLERIQ